MNMTPTVEIFDKELNSSSYIDSFYGVVVRVSNKDVSKYFVDPQGVRNFCVVFYNTSEKKIYINFDGVPENCLNAVEIMRVVYSQFEVQGSCIFAVSPLVVTHAYFADFFKVAQLARIEVAKYYDFKEINRFRSIGWQYFLLESSYHGVEQNISGKRYHYVFSPSIDLSFWTNIRFYETDKFVSDGFSDFISWTKTLEEGIDFHLIFSSSY